MRRSSPPSGRSASSLPLDKTGGLVAAGRDAVRIADIVLSFQTRAEAGARTSICPLHTRAAPGEAFAPNNRSRIPGEADFDMPHDTNWNYVGTFDNDATMTQLRYLAKVIAAAGTNNGASASWRKAFMHGIAYVALAQYPNGGWPQVWPLEGGYHDTITYNDDAMVNLLGLLRDVALATNEFAFVPLSVRALAGSSVNRGIRCLLATQITVGSNRTVWCQQHDPLTLQPASGRNYEMPAAVSSESADIMLFLMSLPKTNPALVAAVHAAAAWFEKTKISDTTWRRGEDGVRRLVHESGAGPIWARYYEIGTDRPLFGDRDKTIHDNLDEISQERQRGYAWYRDTPKHALEVYAVWSKTHPNTAMGAGVKIAPQVVDPIAGPPFRIP